MSRAGTRAEKLHQAAARPRMVIRKQGDLLEVQVVSQHATPPIKKQGTSIKGFSDASRLRLLKFVATVDWSAVSDGRFITLTYPPELEMRTRRQRNMDRAKFFRYMEKHLNRKVAGIWRIEWKVRQSGTTKGNLAPHFHLILPDVGWIPYGYIHLWWRKAIGSTRAVSIKCEVIYDGEQCGQYIGKYCAKRQGSLNLDNPLLLNSNGRHYGYVRKNLLKRHPIRWIKYLDKEMQEGLMCIATEYLPWINGDRIESFTALGLNAHEIEKELDEIRLDRSAERV